MRRTTPQEVLDLFEADFETGILRFKSTYRKHKKPIGSNQTTNKYLRVGINKKDYCIHRILYELAHGIQPTNIYIDHINGDCKDNRLINLRAASCAQNGTNAKARPKKYGIGLKGASWHKKSGWTSRIKGLHVGLYKTEQEAHRAYVLAAHVLHKEFANDGGSGQLNLLRVATRIEQSVPMFKTRN